MTLMVFSSVNSVGNFFNAHINRSAVGFGLNSWTHSVWGGMKKRLHPQPQPWLEGLKKCAELCRRVLWFYNARWKNLMWESTPSRSVCIGTCQAKGEAFLRVSLERHRRILLLCVPPMHSRAVRFRSAVCPKESSAMMRQFGRSSLK